MTTKAQKVRVGVFVTIAFALLAVVLVSFAGMRFWESRTTYYVVFDGSVMGLQSGANVFLNGMRVGLVDKIEPAPDDLRKVRVKIRVDEDAPVKTDTKAVLQYAGITGLKVIDLRDGTAGAADLPAHATIAEGETLLDEFEKRAKTLADESTELMKRANRVVANVEALTDPRKFDGIDQIVANTRETSEHLAKTSAQLGAMVAENRADLRRSIAAVGETARTATQLIDGQISQLVVNGHDLVSQLKTLVTGNESSLRAAVFDLRQASKNFKELAREVRQRPSRLLFSNAPRERKLP